MDNDGRNDYDRIAETIREITSIVWAAAVVEEHYDAPNPAHTLTGPALQEATNRLNQLHDWVCGLATSQRAPSKNETAP